MQAMLGERMTRYYGLLIGAAIVVLPCFASAAELSFSPSAGSFSMGKEMSIKVTIQPAGDSVNAADGTVAFDPSALSVSSISKDGSAFSLWTADPQYSNSAGTISFSGGTPTAFSNSGTVLTIKFKAKKAGETKLSFTKGSILAADGRGTDVYTKGNEATLTITEGGSDAADEEGADAGGSGIPLPPTITSITHPKEENWYATSTVEFSWKEDPDATGVRSGISDKEDGKPETEHETSIVTQRLTDVKDGVWYVFVQFKNELGWGEIGKRKIQIDTVPPKEFELALVEGDTPKFSFIAEDELSGMDRYEILLGGTAAGSIKAQDLTDGYAVPAQGGGPQKVTIKAFDKAGNVREVTKDMTLPEVVKASSKSKEEEAPAQSLWTIERILTILFAFAIGALATWNFYTRKNAQKEKARILQEVSQVRDKNDKIFSAMREEFEQMVNDFDEKPLLTPQEREFLEQMKEALDISEELVDSGMEELKKTIRGIAE